MDAQSISFLRNRYGFHYDKVPHNQSPSLLCTNSRITHTVIFIFLLKYILIKFPTIDLKTKLSLCTSINKTLYLFHPLLFISLQSSNCSLIYDNSNNFFFTSSFVNRIVLFELNSVKPFLFTFPLVKYLS